MGTDKAFVLLDGRPLVSLVVDAVRGAGIVSVVVVGGDTHRLEALGLTVVRDDLPGEGPLGGILTALSEARRRGLDTVFVASCDVPRLTSAVVVELLAALEDAAADVAVAVTTRPEPLCAAWSVSRCAAVVQSAFESGERSVIAALAGLTQVSVAVEPGVLVNLNRPRDLEGL